MEASYAQTSFLGGELSKWAQGQFDKPRYKMALSKALNIIISDEGVATRRPGTQFLGTTRNGNPGRLIPFDFSQDSPYNMEFTDGFIRFWNGTSLVTSNDSQVIIKISNASPAVFSITNAVTWKTGDEIYFTFDDAAQAVVGAALLNRQFRLTMLTPTTFTINDAVTGQEIDASMLNPTPVGSISFDGPFSSGPISDSAMGATPAIRIFSVANLAPTVNHIAQLTTSYTEAGIDWHSVRSVQGLELAVLLQGQSAPQALQVLTPPAPDEFATFEFSQPFFQDGPYLDPPPNAIATPSGLSGGIQVTVGYTMWSNTTVYGYGVPVSYSGQDYISLLNNNLANTPNTSPTSWQALPLGSMISGDGFVATDVGRLMRLFSAPLDWSPDTTYAAGNTVTYNGSYFTSLINSNSNNQPDISTTDWVINTSAAVWTWGTVIAVVAPNIVSLQINGGNLLYTTACPLFRIGAWSNTTGWPTCGCYKGGRFWFAGAIANRVDSSQPNTPFIMSPTLPDGTVTDASAISYTFNSNSVDQILWMEPLLQGILCGTEKGEYLLSSGTNGGPITPSSIAEAIETKYGSADALPVKTGLTICFIQRYARRLLEYLADVFSQRFYGPDLTTFVRHLGVREFQEVTYQQEPVPIVWGRMSDGTVVGTTYRRVSLFSNQEPEFNAWHQHAFGSGRLVESICVGPSTNGELDTLGLVSNDPSNDVRFVTSLTPLLDETDPLTSAWFLDTAVTPQAASFVTYGTPAVTYVRFYGLSHLEGRNVSVFAAALDCGDYFVKNGSVDVPLGTVDSISGYTFDLPQLAILQPLISTFATLAVTIVGGKSLYTIPCVIGFNYPSQGQLCRPMMQADTGARNGPGFAKKRRTARYGINLVDSMGVQVGTDFTKTKVVPLASPMGNMPPYLSSYSGIIRETLGDDNSFDSMLCWQTLRPYPTTVVNFGGFITTEDV